MEKLVKPAEYARNLGISRQAVYAKIKRGILTAKNVEGKLYIVLDEVVENRNENIMQETLSKEKIKRPNKSTQKDYKALLEAKDETIVVLKSTVKDLKKSNKQISTTLKGEIDLLKEAFHEMRSLYIMQLEQNIPEQQEVIEAETSGESWIGLKKFFKIHKITKKKHKEKIIKRFKKAEKRDDIRLVKIDEKLKIDMNASYEDILK